MVIMLSSGYLEDTDLDCECAQCRNNVKATICDTVLMERWVKLPDGSLVFYCCNICDVAHEINGGQVNDMTETPTEPHKSHECTEKSRIRYAHELLLPMIPCLEVTSLVNLRNCLAKS